MVVELEYDYAKSISGLVKFSQSDIDELKQWTLSVDNSKYIPKDLSDKQLLLFYNACETDLGNTKICIEKYYHSKKNAPDFFLNRNVEREDIKPYVEALEFSYFPAQSREGYDIIFHRLHNTDPSKYSLEAGVKLLFMTVDACINTRGPQRGYIFLFDMKGVKIGHLMKLSISSLRKFFQYVQEACPIRMRAVHVLNTEPILDKLLLLIKPFMNKQLYDMIKFHNKNVDMEEFYKNYIPKSALPSDFGGDLPSVHELHISCMKRLKELQTYFEDEERQRLEAIPEKHKKDKDLDKSFKKLEID